MSGSEVIVRKREQEQKHEECYSLRGKAIRYTAPFDSVAEEEWEVLRLRQSLPGRQGVSSRSG